MSQWLEMILVAWGVSTINYWFLEAYFTRRAMDEVGDYDEGME